MSGQRKEEQQLWSISLIRVTTKGQHIKFSEYLLLETAGTQQDIVKDYGQETRNY